MTFEIYCFTHAHDTARFTCPLEKRVTTRGERYMSCLHVTTAWRVGREIPNRSYGLKQWDSAEGIEVVSDRP